MDSLLQMGISNSLMATLLAILAAAAGRFCRRPALVHCMWLLVLLKLVTPSFVVLPVPWPDGSKAQVKTSSAEPTPGLDTVAKEQDAEPDQVDELMPTASANSGWESAESLPSPDVDRSGSAPAGWSVAHFWPALGILWLAGSISWFSFVAYRIHRFCHVWRSARPAPPALCEQVQRLAERLGLMACPSVWLLPGHVSPMVCTLGGRPRLFVSSALWERLSSEQQATLLLHELAHLRRRDHWIRGLELLVIGLYWWHPVVWWACREIREAEEQCCDAWVVWTLPEAARTYATALVETLDFLSETPNALPAVASGIGHVHDLRRRLTMIMHGTTPRRLSATGLVVVLGLGAFLLALRPTWAQTRAAQEADEQRVAAEQRAQEAEAQQQERRARVEREELGHQKQALAQEVERMRANVERAMSELRRAEERLAELQDQERRSSREAGRARTEPRAATPRGRTSAREQGSDPERRISELERKLEELLNEVQSLRREMRRTGPRGMTPGGPGMPGAMAPPTGPTPRPGAAPRFPGAPGAGVPPTPARPAQPALAPPGARPEQPEPPEAPRLEESSSVPVGR